MPWEAPLSATAITLEALEAKRADLLIGRETLYGCRPCGCGFGVASVGIFVI